MSSDKSSRSSKGDKSSSSGKSSKSSSKGDKSSSSGKSSKSSSGKSSSGKSSSKGDKSSSSGSYIIFGIDFTNFLGTGIDLSGIIDTVGGALNFEISSILSCLLSIFLFILLFIVTNKEKKGKGKGLEIPGIGILGPQQPLVIEMPIQTNPYPLFSSPYPRDT